MLTLVLSKKHVAVTFETSLMDSNGYFNFFSLLQLSKDGQTLFGAIVDDLFHVQIKTEE